MIIKKITATAAFATSAVAIAAATAYADPVPRDAVTPVAQDNDTGVVHLSPNPQNVEINGVHYTGSNQGNSFLLTAPDATFQPVNDSLVVTNAQGDRIDSIPLSYRRDATEFPIAAEVSDHTVKLTPITDPIFGRPAAEPITTQALAAGTDASAEPVSESFTPRDQQELSAFGQRATIATLVGAVVGALIGGVVGCVAGGIVGSVSTAITTLFAGVIPGAIIGCIAGIATVGAVGTVLGTALVSGPILLWSAFQYFSTILGPCGGPGTFCVDPAAPPVPAAPAPPAPEPAPEA